MNQSEYYELIAIWKKKYGVYNPAQVAISHYSPARVRLICGKCLKLKSSSNRHHIANDFFFALQRPDLYAARYILFLPDDVDNLCKQCHVRCHVHYTPLAKKMYAELAALNGTPSQEWCEHWKQLFRAVYSRWITRPLRKRKQKRRRKRGINQTRVR